ncbi:MAG: YhjD/YihY/BrkB family envelope integrity protein [Candidatus Cloacimonetes bacterium]|nr:YhjD/YihY/BrkB family envelope integrity protein [Candidatus Cloacimonadota bacterium]
MSKRGLFTIFKRRFLILYRNLLIFERIYSEKKVFKEASALTFVTLMGFIPFGLFLLFLLPEIPFIQGSTIKESFIDLFLPSSAEQIRLYIDEMMNQKGSINLINFVILLVTSFGLFRIINDAFDSILNVHELRKKDIIFNLMKFLGMIAFGFIITLILFSSASLPLFSNLFKLKFLGVISAYVIPFLLLFILILLFYLFVPTIRIKRTSIATAAAISSIVWFIVKYGFNYYINNLTNIQVVYGVISALPIFMMWVYINWTIILSGVIIVSILEKRYTGKNRNLDKRMLKITLEQEIDGEICSKQNADISKEELEKVLKKIITD